MSLSASSITRVVIEERINDFSLINATIRPIVPTTIFTCCIFKFLRSSCSGNPPMNTPHVTLCRMLEFTFFRVTINLSIYSNTCIANSRVGRTIKHRGRESAWMVCSVLINFSIKILLNASVFPVPAFAWTIKF